jgi:hypothetical protein
LGAALDSAPDADEARLRLRTVLRRLVDSVWLYVASRGKDRLAFVRVTFAGGERHRNFLILHRPPFGNRHSQRPGRWWVASDRAGCPPWHEPATAEDLQAMSEYMADRLEGFRPDEGGDDEPSFDRTGIVTLEGAKQPEDTRRQPANLIGLPVPYPRKPKG